MVRWIEFVQRVQGLLASRSVDVTEGLEELTAQTGWLMKPLLEECLQWPNVHPHVREPDGIRRLLQCWLCREREHPEGSGEALCADETLCDSCLLRMIDLLDKRTPPDGVIFFRTYNKSRWCPHADSETVLMTCDEYDFLADGRCSRCLADEYKRRRLVST